MYDLALKYHSSTYKSFLNACILMWSGPGLKKQVVPQANLGAGLAMLPKGL